MAVEIKFKGICWIEKDGTYKIQKRFIYVVNEPFLYLFISLTYHRAMIAVNG
jgi:hypothetical protein